MSDPIPGLTVPAENGVSPAWSRTGVILLAHGAPDRLEDIPDFLLKVRGGRPLPDAVIKEISRRYERIGGGSPLLQLTNVQACKLAAALNSAEGLKSELQGQTIPVFVGMRNWKPFIPDSVRQLAGLGVERIIAICLAPQNSRTSIGLYRKYLFEALERGAPDVQVNFVESWHDQPELIIAFQDRIRQVLPCLEAQAKQSVPVILSAHSVPARTVEAGDPYESQVRETAASVAEGLELKDWCVAFQSQGMTEERWIGPTVESQIDRIAAAGHRHALICPVGFVSDHVEVLYDIDIAFKEFAAACDLTLHRTASLNDSALFVKALEALVRSRFFAFSTNNPTQQASLESVI
jgi:protoporphyrin/coproporphyrin ferrochelatase